MPYYWQVKDKNGKVVDPIVIDEQICKHLNITPDPVEYVDDWWDWVGMVLISGKTIQEYSQKIKTSDTATERSRAIWNVLSEYNGEAWYRSRSR